jgi:hypothetical protein
MATEDPRDNREYCRAYYQKVKTDPVKLAEKRRRAREWARKWREIKKSRTVTTAPAFETPGELTLEPEGADTEIGLGDLFG